MSERARPQRPTCPLCGTSDHPTSNEDVLPEWMRRFAGDSASGHPFTGVIRGKSYSEPRPPRIKFKVCRDCNNWMNRTFEEPTRPLILDMLTMHVDHLTSANQVQLARWAAKTMILRAAAIEASRAFIPLDELTKMRQGGGNPSSRSRILIGTYGDGGKVRRQLSDLTGHPVNWNRAVRFSDPAYHCSLVFGPLVIEFLYQQSGERYRSAAELAGLVRPIWPSTGQPIDWPSQPAITASTGLLLDLVAD